MENSSRDGNTRPPDLPLEKSVCMSEENECQGLYFTGGPSRQQTAGLHGDGELRSATVGLNGSRLGESLLIKTKQQLPR